MHAHSLLRAPLTSPPAGHDDSDSEANEPLTLSDLLDVNVVLRSDSMPAIRNLVAQTGTPAEEYSQSLHGIMTGAAEGEGQAGDAEGGQAAESFPDEVVLPLREVLHLVSLVASVEEQVHNTAEDDDATACSSTTLQEDPNASPADSTPSIVTFDPRENVPLLRDIFHCKHSHPAKSGYCNGIKMKSRMRTLSQREEEEIDEVLNEVFDVSTDAEEDEEEEDTEGDNESQLEDDEDEDEGEGERTRRLGDGPKTLQDVEAGNYCMRGKIGCVHKR